jgi:hypothetical protein
VTGNPFLDLVALPIAFGLFGFIEPCSIGSTLIFVKAMEGKPAPVKLAQVSLFAGSRAAFIGILGAIAVMVGGAFFGFQKAAWILLGAVRRARPALSRRTDRLVDAPSIRRRLRTSVTCFGRGVYTRDDQAARERISGINFPWVTRRSRPP